MATRLHIPASVAWPFCKATPNTHEGLIDFHVSSTGPESSVPFNASITEAEAELK
jgi:hypothetical protein